VAASEKPVSEKSSIGEKSPENEPKMKPLAKIQKPLESKTKEFSPMAPKPDFSPIKSREFSPMKKVALKLVNPAKNGQRGRPRNPNLPPAPDKYFYWTKAGNGLKLEKRKPYEYVGFIMPAEWQTLRGIYDEEYILKTILAAIRVKRARSVAGPRHSASVA
jgi:hypothetical protein